MDMHLLSEAKHLDKYVIFEKEVTYKVVNGHTVSSKKYILDSPASVQDFMEGLFEESPIEVL